MTWGIVILKSPPDDSKMWSEWLVPHLEFFFQLVFNPSYETRCGFSSTDRDWLHKLCHTVQNENTDPLIQELLRISSL